MHYVVGLYITIKDNKKDNNLKHKTKSQQPKVEF